MRIHMNLPPFAGYSSASAPEEADAVCGGIGDHGNATDVSRQSRQSEARPSVPMPIRATRANQGKRERAALFAQTINDSLLGFSPLNVQQPYDPSLLKHYLPWATDCF